METESKLFSLMDAYYHLFNNSTLSNSSAVNCLNQLVEFRRELKIAKKNLSSSKSFSSIASNIISKPGVPKSLKLVDSKPNSQLSSTSFVYEDCDMYEDDQSTLNIASNTETLAAQPVKAAFVYRTPTARLQGATQRTFINGGNPFASTSNFLNSKPQHSKPAEVSYSFTAFGLENGTSKRNASKSTIDTPPQQSINPEYSLPMDFDDDDPLEETPPEIDFSLITTSSSISSSTSSSVA